MFFFRSLCIAFSMYSKFPVPHVEWKEKDMRYAICFFPLIGLLIGVFLYIWETFCEWKGCNIMMRTLVACLVPILVTGGIHIDGWMDTNDALHSYQPREKKLLILKDSHIGAFSVIMLMLYAGIYLAAASEITGKSVYVWGLSFVLSRCLSGLSVVTFQNAKKEGTLYTFSSAAHKKRATMVLLTEIVLCLFAMWMIDFRYCIGTGIAAGIAYYYYKKMSGKEFGGITGDIAGWFLCLCECFMVVTIAAIVLFTS